jgi:hypothetical protein
MKSTKIILCFLACFAFAYRVDSQATTASKRIVIAASTVLDGRGRVLRDTRIVVERSKIVAVDAKTGPVDYDLRAMTVLPGWIDAHARITWSFGKDGKNADADVGLHHDPKPGLSHRHTLRDGMAKGALPGSRILTAVEA